MHDSIHSSPEEDRYFCVGSIRGIVLIAYTILKEMDESD